MQQRLRLLLLFVAPGLAASALAQTPPKSRPQQPQPAPDLAWSTLDAAYKSLRVRDYDQAVALFRAAIAISPHRIDVRKDLAYTLLKIGEPKAARMQFEEVMKREPKDFNAALEYAFLAFETGEPRLARLVFDRVRHEGDSASRATAERAFANVDGPLAEGIARWKAAVEREPGNFSAHHELASLAERRNDWSLAAKHYEAAWRIKPGERYLLLDLGRAWKEAGQRERAVAALLAASRGDVPRVAERARTLLPTRYPYVYEFREAIQFDPGNRGLRRELAYLLLEMGKREEAEAEFEKLATEAPDDHLSNAQLGFLLWQRKDFARARPLLDKVLQADVADEDLTDGVRATLQLPKQLKNRAKTPRPDLIAEARELAQRSYDAGFLKDALKYLAIVHENDPLDFSVMLKLGWANNLLKRDREAMGWFALARQSSDPSIAAEAQRAYSNLKPQFARVRSTFWTLPFYSSRWNNAFSYGQFKSEFKVPGLKLSPYASMRIVGDARGSVNAPYPQYLSETAVILGVGIATPVYKGAMGWAEAGQAMSYLRRTDQPRRVLPDYRGGVSYSRGFGHLLGAEKAGLFVENHEDAVFVSRFNNSLLLYTQNKFGYTLPMAKSLAELRVQFYWNANATADAKRQYWANFVETGPGIRLRWKGLPPSMVFSVDLVRGAHTINEYNPRRPNFYDIRAGFWYAFSR